MERKGSGTEVQNNRNGSSTEISFEIEIETPHAKIIESCLAPEILQKKFEVEQRAENGKYFLRIAANDLSAVRAGVNSYLRWLSLLEKVEEVIEWSSRRKCSSSL